MPQSPPSELGARRRRAQTGRAGGSDAQGDLQRRLETAVNNISQGICLFGADERLQFANDRYFEIYGFTREALPFGTSFLDMLRASVAAGKYHGRTAEELWARFTQAFKAHQRLSLENVVEAGRLIAVEVRVLDGGGWVATHEDITERRRAEEQIRFLAHHDPLTRLPNRLLFDECIRAALAEAQSVSCALLLLDLDGFKLVNDRLGHKAGDSLLVQVADRLRLVCQANGTGTAARLGGDEFAVLLSAMSRLDAFVAAQRVVSALSGDYDLGSDGCARVGTSIGMSFAPEDGLQPDLIMSQADRAMYAAKNAGGSRAMCFSHFR